MHILLRPLVILLLTAFAGGMFAHSVAASTMAFDMAVVQSGSTAMGDCPDCDETAMQSDDAACDMVCDMAFVATLPETAQLAHPQRALPKSVHREALIGHIPPLGLFPPRTTFLN